MMLFTFMLACLAFASAQRALVIGSGAAGLQAAFRLQQKNYSVDVAEARDRVGGRLYTSSALGAPVDWVRSGAGCAKRFHDMFVASHRAPRGFSTAVHLRHPSRRTRCGPSRRRKVGSSSTRSAVSCSMARTANSRPPCVHRLLPLSMRLAYGPPSTRLVVCPTSRLDKPSPRSTRRSAVHACCRTCAHTLSLVQSALSGLVVPEETKSWVRWALQAAFATSGECQSRLVF